MLLTKESAKKRTAPEKHPLVTGHEVYLKLHKTGAEQIEYRRRQRELDKSFDREAEDYDSVHHGMALFALKAQFYAVDKTGAQLFEGETAQELLDNYEYPLMDAVCIKVQELEGADLTTSEAEKKY
ncbi:hypothetical protein [Marinobacterium lutimaris]|uniref:Uncharacterized protein n=1 Tax=Marinobacterium lutimaris TaxID=568106 RepID=A0A1H5XSC6_9GAMM|nr:hypothetical protein [Marinobacterium lutimaris]SEG14631.1 hypothetical protein SAMN05444390_1011487 [Marinobacterium lutimaris]